MNQLTSTPTIHTLRFVESLEVLGDEAQSVLREIQKFFRNVLDYDQVNYLDPDDVLTALASPTDAQVKEGLDATEWEGSWAASVLESDPEGFEFRRAVAAEVAPEFEAFAKAYPDVFLHA